MGGQLNAEEGLKRCTINEMPAEEPHALADAPSIAIRPVGRSGFRERIT